MDKTAGLPSEIESALKRYLEIQHEEQRLRRETVQMRSVDTWRRESLFRVDALCLKFELGSYKNQLFPTVMPDLHLPASRTHY